jgi:hypothetical protein
MKYFFRIFPIEKDMGLPKLLKISAVSLTPLRWFPRSHCHRRNDLRIVNDTAEIVFLKSRIPQKLQCFLLLVIDTAEMISVVSLTPQKFIVYRILR